MRNMSFMLTTQQMRARTKTVTRRDGWESVRSGDTLCAIEKGQGLKRGEKVTRLGLIQVTDIRRERLNAITEADCAAEGFPNLTPAQFVDMFCQSHKGCYPAKVITRIEFRHLVAEGQPEE